MAIFGGEATKHIEYLRGFTNGLTDVAQGVSEALEFAGVGGDIHVALDKGSELRLEVHGAMELVVAELLADRAPDGICRRRRLAHNSADVFGD